MSTTVQILRQVAAEIEGTPGTYQEPNVQLPFTSFTVKQSFDMITDASIMGQAFPDLPVQGMRHINGSLAGQFDVDTADVMLEAVTGNATSPYITPNTKNEKTLSLNADDEIKTYKYGGCVANSYVLQSAAEGDLNFTSEIIGWKAETRDDSGFPTPTTSPGVRLVHHHAGGTNGYVRVGDQANGLTSGDNIDVNALSFGLNWNFAEQATNDQGTLQPLSGAGGVPECTFSFTVSRHTVDTWHAARDAHTALQADINYYAAATAILQIEVSNFVIVELNPTEDDIPMIEVVCFCARNGISTNYSNAQMSFNTPMQFTVTNS